MAARLPGWPAPARCAAARKGRLHAHRSNQPAAQTGSAGMASSGLQGPLHACRRPPGLVPEVEVAGGDHVKVAEAQRLERRNIPGRAAGIQPDTEKDMLL